MELQLAMLMQVLDRSKMSSQVRLLVVTTKMHQAPVLIVNVQGARTTPIFLQIQSTADGMRMLVWLSKFFLDPADSVKPAGNSDYEPCQ